MKSSYPRDIAIIAAVFIFLILFLAIINLYISSQFRREYIKDEQNRVFSLINLCETYLKRYEGRGELNYLLKSLSIAFGLDHLSISDTTGNKIYDSWTIPHGFESMAFDYLKSFKRLPKPGELIQHNNDFIYLGTRLPLYIYIAPNPRYSTIDQLFRWHIFYITISLLFISFLGIFLIRNLFLPMHYVTKVAKEFGIEMKREDFVSATFNEIFNQMKAREKLLVELSSYIAHEFRNSLATITGLARLVEKGRKSAADIIKECETMNDLISAILEYSRPLKPTISSVDVAQLITDAVGRIAIPKRITLQQKIDSGLLLKGDYEFLLLAITNLLKNCVEAIEDKGFIVIEAEGIGEYIHISVSDTGCGIERQELDKLFSPFYSKKEKGIGLGLAYVKKIMEIHNGKIEVDSQKGKGTKIVLRFPA